MILILGARGQVARALIETAGEKREVRAIGSDEFDLTQISLIEDWLEKLKPEAIINSAAYTKVDLAESHHEDARRLNAEVPRELARYARANKIPLIHYSTDYVFPGEGEEPQAVDARKGPVNFYGQSKLEGEEEIRASGCEHAILRSSWIYAEAGLNFVRTMLTLGASKSELRVVADQIGSPTWAHDLALCTWETFDQKRRGTYHACGAGFVSWHGFATEIFRLAKARGLPLQVEKVIPVSSLEYPTAARRPLNSRLANTLIRRPWAEALAECMRRIK